MEVDVRVRGEHDRVVDPVTALRELREAPLEHSRLLSVVLRDEFGDSHVVQSPARPERYTAVSPPSTAQTAARQGRRSASAGVAMKTSLPRRKPAALQRPVASCRSSEMTSSALL